ncbi:MAG TPA: acyl-ACP thioesterase domain-containing protein [Candidatus Limnocylindrales bacterium]|nr:acyl-ACP thioesterase domain-containing protein [Candidatus Limnocylindrales bacterium]
MIDSGLTGRQDRPVEGIDNGFVAGYRVRFDEAGADGRIRTSTLLRYAQDVAWRHSEDLGFDREWYVDRGRWWVVRAVELDVIAPIAMGQTLRVSTAVIGHGRRIWARRESGVRLADGALAARVITDWVLLDERGRPVRIPPDFGLSFTNPELGSQMMRVDPELLVAAPDVLRIRVRPQDLDPMGHVNNAAYLDWLEEALASVPPARLGVADVPRRARLEYLASAAPGDEVVVAMHRVGGEWAGAIRRADGVELLRAEGSTDPLR